ncbi:MAG: hypothetical protein AAGL96_09020 [Pseudomonadota bacterium]
MTPEIPTGQARLKHALVHVDQPSDRDAESAEIDVAQPAAPDLRSVQALEENGK